MQSVLSNIYTTEYNFRDHHIHDTATNSGLPLSMHRFSWRQLNCNGPSSTFDFSSLVMLYKFYQKFCSICCGTRHPFFTILNSILSEAFEVIKALKTFHPWDLQLSKIHRPAACVLAVVLLPNGTGGPHGKARAACGKWCVKCKIPSHQGTDSGKRWCLPGLALKCTASCDFRCKASFQTNAPKLEREENTPPNLLLTVVCYKNWLASKLSCCLSDLAFFFKR